MLVDLGNVLRGRKPDALVGLRHQVADEDSDGACGRQRLRDRPDEQVGDQRRIERAGAKGDEVCFGDGLEGLRKRLRIGRFHHQFDDAVRAGGDVRLAADD